MTGQSIVIALKKSSVFPVHTKPPSWRCTVYPLWKSSIFGWNKPLLQAETCFSRLHVGECAQGSTAQSKVFFKKRFSQFGVVWLSLAQSPDLNPIQHLWDELEHRSWARIHRPTWPTSLMLLWLNGRKSLNIVFCFISEVFVFLSLRAIINHFNPKIESYAAVNHISQLSEEQVNTTHFSSFFALPLKVSCK